MQWRNHHIEDIEVDLLLRAMKDRYGYDFTGYARASLKRRLQQLREYVDVERLSDLIPSLLYDEKVAQMVVNNISVPVSEFFRDPAVWCCLRKEILPRLDAFPRINIWQPGCGRGQETYSLLILLREAGMLQKTRLVATDINARAMDDARSGRWPARDMDQWRASYQAAGGKAVFDDYFRRDGGDVLIADELLRHVEFNQHNLTADDVFMEAQFVVCRNVLIYFDTVLQDRVLGLFARSLQRGGYLLLGSAESMTGDTATATLFQQVDADCVVFRRTAEPCHV